MLDRALQACGQVLHGVGVTMIAIFVVSTFRPREHWAKALAVMMIGLADPMVTNRFVLWGSASLGTALATWTSSIGFFLPQPRPELRLGGLLVRARPDGVSPLAFGSLRGKGGSSGGALRIACS